MREPTEILWHPQKSAFSTSALARFAIAQGFDPAAYDSLHRWSVSEPGAFWGALWDFAGVLGDKGEVDLDRDPERPMTGSTFFPGANLNLAENLLKGDPRECAIAFGDETGAFGVLTKGELSARVARVADGLKATGVCPGDRVAGIMPNDVDALVATLATLSIGGVWTACSPDFGAIAITDRIGQVEPKVLFAAPFYRYAGRTHDISERIASVLNDVSSIQAVIATGGSDGSSIAATPITAFGAENASLSFERFNFDHPAFILYTSGTTGLPKAIVHGAGGSLMKHLSEHMLHGDVGPDDQLIWYTNIAWMMYPWMLGAMACGASIALFDGAPILKGERGLDCAPLWSFVETAGVTQLGVSPKYLATLQSESYSPAAHFDLSGLRHLMVCGAPCLPHQFDWVYQEISADCPFSSISGGTEVLGCFLTGSPLHPVRRGELTVPALGMAVQVLDERGANVIGTRGELVCTEPFPSMPLTFWGDGGRQRYLDTYFSDRPEIWTHGDIAELTATGGALVHGRSDTTLNPGGVRIGTSEVYGICETYDAIDDVLMFGAAHEGDEVVVLAILPARSGTVTKEIVAQLRAQIRKEVSPRHVPARVHLVDAIPYTINGKRVEGAARAAINGQKVVNRSSLANPECLDQYQDLTQQNAL